MTLWYDKDGVNPVTAFVVFRNTIIAIECVARKWMQGQRLSRKTFVTLPDGATQSWSYSNCGHSSLDPDNGNFPLGEEVVVWRHSRMFPDDYEITRSCIWDNEIKHKFESVIDDHRRSRKAMSSYYRGGGQMKAIMKPWYRDSTGALLDIDKWDDVDAKERMSQKYLIVIEKAEEKYAAYSPDLPGCVATGDTKEETERTMREAIRMHLDGMKEDGLPIPKPSATAEYVDV